MGFTGVSFHLGMSSSKAGSSCEGSWLSLESKSVNIPTECITEYTQLHNKRGANKPSFLIYKISDDKRSIEVEESSTERNYEASVGSQVKASLGLKCLGRPFRLTKGSVSKVFLVRIGAFEWSEVAVMSPWKQILGWCRSSAWTSPTEWVAWLKLYLALLFA